MLNPDLPALILAPMDGITDAPMRAVQGEAGAFSFAVSEFLRVSIEVIPRKVFLKHVPELASGATTPTGLPVAVQLLGGDPERMAKSALVALKAGAKAIDINFGCPAPTVNRHDGGATLLQHPKRIREIVAAVREAVPPQIPVSAKMRLGWDSIEPIYKNAEMAAQGGASWLTIHARTRTQGYQPPVYWKPIGTVRECLNIPVVANGDLWTLEGFRQCREETGCRHFMLGRGALANPVLPHQIAQELGIGFSTSLPCPEIKFPPPNWSALLMRLVEYTRFYEDKVPSRIVLRLKQWLRLASVHGDFIGFDEIKRTETPDEFFACLNRLQPAQRDRLRG